MGALHEGHLSLVERLEGRMRHHRRLDLRQPQPIRAERRLCHITLARSRPTWKNWPAADGLRCRADDAEVYREGHATWVDVGSVAEPLEGRFRPGHFRGVATVVLKMFNMIQPDAAYFGQKDYQQAAVIRRMVADLNVPVEIRVCKTVREPDGLAMSSRNVHLSPDARRRAAVLWQSLKLAQQLVAQGQHDAACIQRQMSDMILAAGGNIDYVALVDPESLAPVTEINAPVLAALAVKFEGTRLIDNMTIG